MNNTWLQYWYWHCIMQSIPRISGVYLKNYSDIWQKKKRYFLRKSSNFDSTTLNNAIRIIYMYAFYHINSHNRFIPDSALKLENILYYNHISYYFKNELLWNSIDALFHTGSSLDRWISRCPTQTFITQENDWIFYTNARIVESCLAHRWPSSKRYFDISSIPSKRLL